MAEFKPMYSYLGALEALKDGARTAEEKMAKAITGAFRDLAKDIEKKGRAHIAAEGFGPRWQRGFIVRAKPRVAWDLHPSLRGYLKGGLPQIMNIFERGGTIHPNHTWLYVPLPWAPQRIGRKRATPAQYEAQIGPLFRVERPGQGPLLMGQATRRPAGKVSVGVLKTGAKNAAARKSGGKGRKTVAVPIFVGIKTAHVRDRLNMDRIYQEARRELPKYYFARMSKIRADAR
jgi:hypothetical protein